MQTHKTFDVVVIGGGPAGSAAALTFARAGWRVLLAEAIASTNFKIGETLPPSAYPLLRDLGLSTQVEKAGHLRCPGTVAFWGDERPAERDFIRELHGAGWHLDRPRFDADLRAAAAAAGAEVRLACSFGGWSQSAIGEWELRFACRGGDSLQVTTPWVVDATGRRALFAAAQGAVSRRDDALVAFCVVASAGSGRNDARTLIESSEDGWWYSALLAEGQRLVAFFTDDNLPAAREVVDVSGFSRRLANTAHLRFTTDELPITGFSRVRRFPACSLSRQIFGGEGWIAIGDATLAFDPLSSQGIFHGLYTGLRGAQTVMARAGGDTTALLAWHRRLQSIHARYRHHLAHFYRMETRWADSPFWKRRQSKGEVDTGSPSGLLAGEVRDLALIGDR